MAASGASFIRGLLGFFNPPIPDPVISETGLLDPKLPAPSEVPSSTQSPDLTPSITSPQNHNLVPESNSHDEYINTSHEPESKLSATDYNLRRRSELWKMVQNFVSYFIANGITAVGGFYMRVADPNLRTNFLFNSNNPIGRLLINIFVKADLRDRLAESSVDQILTGQGVALNKTASATKLFFAYPNAVINFWEAWRSRKDKILALSRLGSGIRSVGDIVEKQAMVHACTLWQAQHQVSELPGGFELNAINAMAISQLAVVGGAAASIFLNVPLLVREMRNKATGSIMFTDTMNAIGSSTCNMLMAGLTLYFAQQAGASLFGAQPNSPEELDAQFKILNQVFDSKNAILYVNMAIMLSSSLYVLKGQYESLKAAIKSKDTQSRNSLIPRMMAVTCTMGSAVFLNIPADQPAGNALGAAAGAFFFASLFIKHKDYLFGSLFKPRTNT